MKRILFTAIFIAIIFACSSPDTRIDTGVEIPVEVEEVSLNEIEEYIEATGTVYASAEAVMKSETQGYYRLAVNPLTKKPFVLGDNVKKDWTIVYLDNPEQEISIKIESHKLNLGNTQREYDKQKSLYEKGGVTLRDLKNSEISYIDAKYAYEN
ncbi:efflux transporter periplasmic adaptor subunit, partial [bacterium]|nr:efflux transporter periplasmic adaptor subunit [bacterium]